MTVHVLMPVFNRVALTQAMLECLRAQRVDDSLSIVVIDDGSTDATSRFLKEQKDLIVLRGDGSLWWGGAIDIGMRMVFGRAAPGDWVLLVNNDILIKDDFVQNLLDVARKETPAAVGSVIRDVTPPNRLLSLGPLINAWNFSIRDAIDIVVSDSVTAVLQVDALSGRGVIYPVEALRKAGGMRPRWLPHYLADYELAIRVRSSGYKLLVSTGAVVYSKNEYGNAFRLPTLWQRLFSARSPSYIPANVCFWWSTSRSHEKLTMPLRAVVYKLISIRLRKLKKEE